MWYSFLPILTYQRPCLLYLIIFLFWTTYLKRISNLGQTTHPSHGYFCQRISKAFFNFIKRLWTDICTFSYLSDKSIGPRIENKQHLEVTELCKWRCLSFSSFQESRIWLHWGYQLSKVDICPCIFVFLSLFCHLQGIIWIQTNPNDLLWVPLQLPLPEKEKKRKKTIE